MKTRPFILLFLVGMVLIIGCGSPKGNDVLTLLYEDETKVVPHIKELVNQIEPGKPIVIEDEKIFSLKALPDFYKGRNYAPAWDDSVNIMDAVNIIEGAVHEGLTPEDYHFEALQEVWDQVKDINDTVGLDYKWVARLDILFTDAMMLYVFHLLEGKVDPETLDSDWNYGFTEVPGDIIQEFYNALESNSLAELIQKFRPQSKGYSLLMNELDFLKMIAEKGGWDSIPAVQKIEPGDTNALIPLIRKRLIITNDLSDTLNMASQSCDSLLVKDIVVFQRRHGIDADGVVGQGTVDALNIPVGKKMDMIRINLERHRWVVHNLSENFLIVNIAGFELWVYKNNEEIHRTEVMVGKTYHKTPVFKSKMQYIEFNPTWTIPRSITIKETLPKIKKDPNYLSRNNMVLLDGNANIVSHEGIDFSQYSGSNFPYSVRQQAGKGNALGDVKFIFPNQHSVYLHDTPSKSLFSKANRTFSHGCIRVQNPLDMAAVLLNGTEWTREKIDQTISTRQTTRVNLKDPLDVLILYWTTGRDDDDNIIYLADVYDRDQAILDELNERFVFNEELYKKFEKE